MSVHLPEAPISIMGLITIPGKYFAAFMLFAQFIINGPGAMQESLVGVVAGYAWYFGRDAPRLSRRRPDLPWLAWFAKNLSPLFQTPRFFRQLVDGTFRMPRLSRRRFVAPKRPTVAKETTSSASTTSARPDRSTILAAAEARVRNQKST